MTDFCFILGLILGPKKNSFSLVIFSKIFILAVPSLKNRRMGVSSSFYNFMYKLVNIELSPAREAENAILDF